MDQRSDKRILILGAAGMLGHKLCQLYKNKFNVYYTVRSWFDNYKRYGIFDSDRMIENIDVLDLDKVAKTIEKIKPDVVINCVGIIKQLKEAKDTMLSIKINSLFPHQFAVICRDAHTRFFHISTDCVFNGKDGMYTEDDQSDAEDLYGRTKYLGEVDTKGGMTLRTSIVGRELNSTSGLIEWFLSNRNGKVKGFQKAIYTGFTTIALAGIIADLIENHPDLYGLYQVSSDPIDKFALLHLVKTAFKLSVEIEVESQTCIDRSLDSSWFRKKTGFTPPSWQDMVNAMAEDKTPYDKWHEEKQINQGAKK